MALENFFVAFITGLASSLGHCLGMCGSIVAAYTMSRQGPASGGITMRLQPQLVLNVGRLITYGILGAVMGLAGSALDLMGRAAGWQGVLSIIAGVLMLFVGLSLTGLIPSVENPTSPLYRLLGVSRQIGRLLSRQGRWSGLGIGILWGLLPCGLVFAVEINAASTGDPLQGALVMVAFGLGTVPALFGFSLASSSTAARFRQRLLKLAAVPVILFAIQAILRGLAAADLIPSLIIGGVMLW